MAIIIFDILQATGHLNPSFKLAKMLQERGHKVEYTSSEKHEAAIRLQGFNTHNVYQLAAPALRTDYEAAKKKHFAFFRYVMLNTVGKVFSSYLRNIAMYMAERKLMMDRIKQVLDLQPDLIVVDSMAPLYRAVLYYAYDVKVILLQTMMSPTESSGVPPLHDRLVPCPSRWHVRLARLSWCKYYAERYLRKHWRKLIYFNCDPHTLSAAIMQKCGLPKEQLDFRRTINTGLKGVHEVSLAPRSLDFPRSYQNYEVQAGYAVDIDRVEPSVNDEVAEVLKSNRPIVYCSLGTISTVHNTRSAQLLKKIIRAVRHQPWEVLISVGSKISAKELGSVPSNVHVFATLPQLKILKHVNLMITHGGLNSVVECILHEVPMIVCPLNNYWDQNGNAARVVYHGLGVRSQLRWERVKMLTEKIDQVLRAAVFKENIRRMKRKMIQNDQHHQVADMIDALLVDGQQLAA